MWGGSVDAEPGTGTAEFGNGGDAPGESVGGGSNTGGDETKGGGSDGNDGAVGQTGGAVEGGAADERRYSEAEVEARVRAEVEAREARLREVEREVTDLRQERWLGERLREASARAGVEIARDDARLHADAADRERYQASLEAVVREEVARREGSARVVELEARLADLEAKRANPERDRFDTGGSRPVRADVEGLSPMDKIRHALREGVSGQG
jgi:hypothetical protein